MDLVDFVEKGVDAKYVYSDPSLPDPIFYRPITRTENESAIYDAMIQCRDPGVAKIIINTKRVTELDVDDVLPEFYAELRKYSFEVMVGVCYHGMKDFQGPNFTMETIKRSYVDVSAIASQILKKSIFTEEELVEVMKSPEGQTLSIIIHKLKVPITDAAWKLTPAQVDFFLSSYRWMYKKRDDNGVVITQEMIQEDPSRYRDQLVEMFKR